MAVYSQTSDQGKLKKFDKQKYEAWQIDSHLRKMDSTILPLETRNNTDVVDESDMLVSVPQGGMAPMPNMEIRKDIHYTIQIKGYSNKYPYIPKDSLDRLKLRISKPRLDSLGKD